MDVAAARALVQVQELNLQLAGKHVADTDFVFAENLRGHSNFEHREGIDCELLLLEFAFELRRTGLVSEDVRCDVEAILPVHCNTIRAATAVIVESPFANLISDALALRVFDKRQLAEGIRVYEATTHEILRELNLSHDVFSEDAPGRAAYFVQLRQVQRLLDHDFNKVRDRCQNFLEVLLHFAFH